MTAVAATQTLEERITQRVHDSIGDLITEADLKQMIARGVESALFKPRLVKSTSHYGSDHTEPSIVDAIVRRLLDEKITAAVDTYLRENPEKLDQAVKDAVAKGAGAGFMAYLDSKFAGIFQMGIENMQNRGMLPRSVG